MIMSGKDKGREGVVETVLVKGNRVVVEGMNVQKKHLKGNQGQKAGIYDLVKPLAVCKVALVCPNCKKVARVGFKKINDKLVRLCKKCQREIDLKKQKK